MERRLAQTMATAVTLTPPAVDPDQQRRRRTRDPGADSEEVLEALKAGAREVAAEHGDLPEELTVDLGGGAKMEFVLIPAGTFLMGSTAEQAAQAIPGELVFSEFRGTLWRGLRFAELGYSTDGQRMTATGVEVNINWPASALGYLRLSHFRAARLVIELAGSEEEPAAALAVEFGKIGGEGAAVQDRRGVEVVDPAAVVGRVVGDRGPVQRQRAAAQLADTRARGHRGARIDRHAGPARPRAVAGRNRPGGLGGAYHRRTGDRRSRSGTVPGPCRPGGIQEPAGARGSGPGTLRGRFHRRRDQPAGLSFYR